MEGDRGIILRKEKHMPSNQALVPATRLCRQCRRDLPLDTEHFHRHSHHKHGFREVCRDCRREARQNARREAYGKAEKTLVLKYARDIRAGANLPSHERLHYVLSQYLGGTEGIASSFAHHLQVAKPGSRLAVALIRTVVDMIVAEERRREQREEDQQTELSQLSHEALRQRVDDLLVDMLEREGLELVPKGWRCERCGCAPQGDERA
jgi:hypothetical protein